MNIKTVLSKPLHVIWCRVIQLIKWKIYYKIRFWEKVESKVQVFVQNKESWKEKSNLFSENYPFIKIIDSLKIDTEQKTDSILKGSISVFDVDYNFESPIPWNTDWRSDKIWENKYFKFYSFYEKEKTQEYDVKFPWELSRLSFLIPVARSYQINKNSEYLEYIKKTLSDWKVKNPIAYSVNWYPMEVSVRIINLIYLREILLVAQNTNDTIDLVNEILILHGVFLLRNIEYTDVRGNHYSANLTALLLLGQVYKDFYKEAKKWLRYSLKRIEKEFNLQFINDGVNFEKSTSYHRLVVEFYFISFLVMKRSGKEIKPNTLNKFKKACEFIRDYTKPNLLTPIIGDNDSASVFLNDDVTLNNHSNILQLASLFFDDSDLNIAEKVYYSTFELFGLDSKEILELSKEENLSVDEYKDGGFIIVKNKQDYFITDVGEVGMKGRGGHGHNDLFSFELMFDKNDFVIDPGCYTYTGDLSVKSKMKSTAYHNVLQVDNKEMAPLIGEWGISNVAAPYNLKITQNENYLKIHGEHAGYKRLEDSLKHYRVFDLDKNTFNLKVEDHITCKKAYHISRYLHFSENVNLTLTNSTIIVSCEDTKILITYDKYSEATIEDYMLSYNYGSKVVSKKITFITKLQGIDNLFFKLERIKNHE
ncbi:hypothetical protein MHTCC0001_22910 [Flavobacteriaceae bacterium MHTCC 0001]